MKLLHIVSTVIYFASGGYCSGEFQSRKYSLYIVQMEYGDELKCTFGNFSSCVNFLLRVFKNCHPLKLYLSGQTYSLLLQ